VAAHHHVEPFRVLPEDHEVHVLGLRPLERAELLVEEPHGPVVHVEVELEAHPEEDVGGVPIVGHPRVAHRSEEDRAEALAEELEAARRKRLARLQVALRSPVERGHADLAAGGVRHRGERAYRLRDDLDADPVAGDDRDAQRPGGHLSGEGVHQPAQHERREDERPEGPEPEAHALFRVVAQERSEDGGDEGGEGEEVQEVGVRHDFLPTAVSKASRITRMFRRPATAVKVFPYSYVTAFIAAASPAP
jgi:hypothetical protein